MNKALIPKRDKTVLSRTIGGETVILRKDTLQCYLLNHTGSYIWRITNGKNTVDKMVESLTKRYRIDKTQAFKDLKDMLTYMKKQGLIDLAT